MRGSKENTFEFNAFKEPVVVGTTRTFLDDRYIKGLAKRYVIRLE